MDGKTATCAARPWWIAIPPARRSSRTAKLPHGVGHHVPRRDGTRAELQEELPHARDRAASRRCPSPKRRRARSRVARALRNVSRWSNRSGATSPADRDHRVVRLEGGQLRNDDLDLVPATREESVA